MTSLKIIHENRKGPKWLGWEDTIRLTPLQFGPFTEVK